MERDKRDSSASPGGDRRGFLSRIAMLGGLAGGYGLFAYIAGRFLYPARPPRRSWMFVAQVGRVGEGQSLLYRAPNGETINITRRGRDGGVEDFVALSSICPHLGCQVFWEPQNERYFCPCHNGTFDPSGKGTGGPPGDAGQSLSRYNLRVERGLLFIEVPTEVLGEARAAARPVHGLVERLDGICGPGHDPCLLSLGTGPAGTPRPPRGDRVRGS